MDLFGGEGDLPPSPDISEDSAEDLETWREILFTILESELLFGLDRRQL